MNIVVIVIIASLVVTLAILLAGNSSHEVRKDKPPRTWIVTFFQTTLRFDPLGWLVIAVIAILTIREILF